MLKANPLLVAFAIILCIVFPPLAIVGLLVMVVLRVGGFVATESPTARVAGARSAEDWWSNV